MKSLVVAEVYPWPADDGYRLRVSNLIEAFVELGPVDFVCMDGSDCFRGAAPDGITVIDAPEGPERPIGQWLKPWLTTRLPRRILRRDFDAATRRFAEIDQAAYDVCFVSHLDTWHPIGEHLTLPTLVDFDNLEDLLTRTIRKAGPIVQPGDGVSAKAKAVLRWVIASGFNLVDERRWARAQRHLAAHVERTFVCSQLDVARSAIPNVVAVPNGYQRTFEPASHFEPNDPSAPVFLFIGLLSYDPNADAVRWFASSVLPLVRQRLPNATFRVVGRGAEHVSAVAALPGVELVGGVESLEPELRGADVAVIPLRSGAGTRLKVVEAMANRLPMVTTTIGCEGIDLDDGIHAWIRDDAREFAEACVAAVQNTALRATVIDAAERRYLERYQWSSIRAMVSKLALEVVEAQQR
ncbi:MAG: glycosyltransferase [Actinobacteria bacterium]|nr:glycosyltransferase [Actinomycetota bacterium]